MILAVLVQTDKRVDIYILLVHLLVLPIFVCTRAQNITAFVTTHSSFPIKGTYVWNHDKLQQQGGMYSFFIYVWMFDEIFCMHLVVIEKRNFQYILNAGPTQENYSFSL